jgi:hypothetical protein
MSPAGSNGVNNLEESMQQKQGKLASTSFHLNCMRNRKLLMLEMECLLLVWIEDCNKNIPISLASVQAKALKLFPAKAALIIFKICLN